MLICGKGMKLTWDEALWQTRVYHVGFSAEGFVYAAKRPVIAIVRLKHASDALPS